MELEEVLGAAGDAFAALQAAGERLSTAGDWATYDTFLGGGLVGDMMKYDRFDNIFSDWAVRDRIKKSLERVTSAAAQVSLVRRELETRRSHTTKLRDELVGQREELLGG